MVERSLVEQKKIRNILNSSSTQLDDRCRNTEFREIINIVYIVFRLLLIGSFGSKALYICSREGNELEQNSNTFAYQTYKVL